MRTLYRRLYRLLLRLHPAAFRSEFARDMALDFEDALATLGLVRLFLDVTRSLARQWTTQLLSPDAAPAQTPSHPLLAGHYLGIGRDTPTPFELLRGSALFIALLYLFGLAANTPSRRVSIDNLPTASEMHNGGVASGANGPAQPGPGVDRQAAMVPTAPTDAGAGLQSPSRYAQAGNYEASALGLGIDTTPPPSLAPSWMDLILGCALVSAVIWLTSLLVRRARNIGVRVALTALGLIAVVALVVPVPIHILPAHAQARPDDLPKPIAFDVVSIREDRTPSPFISLLQPITRDGYHFAKVPLFTLIHEAYVPSQYPLLSFGAGQIIGAPDWLYSVPYDVDAKVSATDLRQWNDPAEQPAMRHAMLQSLLADRLKLVVHRETRTMPIFDLTVGKNGPTFKPAGSLTPDEIRQQHTGVLTLDDGAMIAGGPNQGRQMLFNVSMRTFAWFLTSTTRRPVQDKTGLKGKYDISYQLEMPPPQQDGAATPPDDNSLQIRTVVQDQLGLKLTPTKGPVEVLIIDHIERPSEN